MAVLDINELVQTIVDQAHTIRRMGTEIERLQVEVAKRAELERSGDNPLVEKPLRV